MKSFCFTVDDNIRFLKEIAAGCPSSIFDHPYLAMLSRLHRRFGVKIQLNLFLETDGFTLAEMSDAYAAQWAAASDWLKLSFHSRRENVCPYAISDYGEVFTDCGAVHSQILRFASLDSLAKTTTVHYCQATAEGLQALADNGVTGLLGLFGASEQPRTSYGLCHEDAQRARNGEVVEIDGMRHASIDMIINKVPLEELVPELIKLLTRDALRVMIHEQYFYGDYPKYQPDFEEKLHTVIGFLCKNDYKSCFFEELI